MIPNVAPPVAAHTPAAWPTVAVPAPTADVEALLDRAQRHAIGYFTDGESAAGALLPDSSRPGSPCSITGVGMALTLYPVAVERGWMTRAEALARTRRTLDFFLGADMSGGRTSTGYRGFYFHFLDTATGRRAWNSELSTIDTAFLVAGMLASARYFERGTAREHDIRRSVQVLSERVEWRWMQQGDGPISHGWKPERGFLRYHWVGYSEALLLYVLALGAPLHPVSPGAYEAWVAGYRWRRIYGHEHLAAGPLFIHQYSHMWLDLRGIQDAYMRGRGIDYAENSRRATLVQHEYALRNPRRFEGYGAHCWGLTACDGPGPRRVAADGRTQRFMGYAARGAPHGPDDGTLAPWAAIASLPFAPEVVLPTLRHIDDLARRDPAYQPGNSFNPGWRHADGTPGWVSPWRFALNSGPAALMIENHRSGLPWRLMRGDASLRRGLLRAGFSGGWLDGGAATP